MNLKKERTILNGGRPLFKNTFLQKEVLTPIPVAELVCLNGLWVSSPLVLKLFENSIKCKEVTHPQESLWDERALEVDHVPGHELLLPRLLPGPFKGPRVGNVAGDVGADNVRVA